ncbi:Cytohesin 1, partial [Balamuthia mandrillaris]
MEDNKAVAHSEEEEEEKEEDQGREEHACKDEFDGKAHRERAPSMNTRRTTSSSVSVSRAATAGEPVVVKEGWLTKKGHVRKNWKRRWFILRKDTEELLYYKSSKVKPTTTPQGVIDLGCYLCDLCNRPKCFQMVSKGKVFVIEADSVEERNDWMKAISTVGEKVEAIPGRDKPKPNKAQKDKPGKGDRRLSFLTKQGKIKRNLSLSNLALTEVPAKTWTLSELRKLDISCNEIATFPLELCSMNKLLSLDFSTNLLKD